MNGLTQWNGLPDAFASFILSNITTDTTIDIVVEPIPYHIENESKDNEHIFKVLEPFDEIQKINGEHFFVANGKSIKIINYDDVKSLRIEAVQKLKLYQPQNIGQASRIAGVSPADVSVLLVYLEHYNHK